MVYYLKRGNNDTAMKTTMRKIPTVLLSVILAFFCLSATGCFSCTGFMDVSVREIAFVADGNEITELTLALGERIELNRYVSVLPARAKNKAFSVKSDNASVVSVSKEQTSSGAARYYAAAAGVGQATLTATSDDGGKTATLTVNVQYAAPRSIEIVPADDLNVVAGFVVMTADNIVPARFSARIDANADPDLAVCWRLNGQDDGAQTLSADTLFSYTPAGVGQTEITATVTDGETEWTDTAFINVYDEVENAAVTYAGELEQNADACSTVRFALTYAPLPAGNPAPVVLWKVNGEERSTGETFDFTPAQPGVYEVEGSINGRKAGGYSVKVRGVIVPQNVWLDYDDCYPQVWVRWDPIAAAAGFEVSIVDDRTGLTVSDDLSTLNLALKNDFTSSGFNATRFLSGAQTVFNTRFKVKVKTLPDTDGVLAESDWSAEHRSQQVPLSAKPYLSKTFYDGARNYYVRSYEEFYEWFAYAMLWRPDAVSDTEGETLYLDYAFGTASSVIERAMDEMHFTGQYSYSGANVGKECSFRILFATDGTPSKRTEHASGESWDAMRPHVNYDVRKARSASYAFPIDGRTPVTVETGDQLYYVAQSGYKPVPKSGSAAARLYAYARNTLRYIITDDMTDVQKLHAIYDWIMWRVIYDEDVLYITDLEEAVKYEAYYLESVFTDKYHYGVCDAMSKAFVLMASIEGFESVRVTGDALSGGERGGHAWNKVKLYGQWYVVDCTWGDFSVQLMPGGAHAESASHLYFLLSDADIADTHIEDAYSDFPATARTRYKWYEEEKVTHQGEQIDFYLSYSFRLDTLQKELDTMAAYMADTAQASERAYFVYPCQTNAFSSYYGYEIVADARYRTETLLSALQTAMSKEGYKQDKDYFVVYGEMGSAMHLLVYLVMA